MPPNATRINKRFCHGMPPIAVSSEAPPPMTDGVITSLDFHPGASRLGGVTDTGTSFSSVTGATLTSGRAASPGVSATSAICIAARVFGPTSPSTCRRWSAWN